ncbi:MAG: uroporphyrinogen-III synthase [Schaalia hyovaginalis]|uniref:uroporphyrinogen-III synthase n=1 Tax=Schaalia hyovaginalis TaxID=29316 RepID=UPI002A83E853|nr:uroporphyrinogen-III synthase [Schaalia hyovaginalis]MDY4262677.1 uroporphyrinogen-III synthase [Schaalia hyovaginalis]MDY6213743.1 uroporphyrinogen-III synthase [Schaalia hyovaginalis]
MTPAPRVLLTRAHSPSAPDPFGLAIEALGVELVPAPLTRTRVDEDERRRALQDLAAVAAPDTGGDSRAPEAWILLTSPRTIRVLAGDAPESLGRLLGAARERGARIGAVGEATARAVSGLGIECDLIGGGSGADLARSLGRPGPGSAARGAPATILLPRSASGDPALATGLTRAGWRVVERPIYDTLPLEGAPDERVRDAWTDPGLLAAVITAPSSLRALLRLLGPAPRGLPLVALGRTSAAACAELAPDSPVLTAGAPTPNAVADALSALLHARRNTRSEERR